MNTPASQAGLRRRDIRRRFDRAAAGFDDADFVHSVTRNGLLERLAPMLVEADTVVDLGCGTGTACRLLSRRFRRCRVIGIDLSANMLQVLKRKQSWRARAAAVQADARALPLADNSVDVVFSNLMLPWVDDPATLFGEVARVLREDGLMLFSTLGPDSLLELRRAWQSVDAGLHVNPFLDMHDIGDAAVRAGLRDPVLDVDRLAVTYENSAALFRDLTATGARNCLRDRGKSLIGRDRFAAMTAALDAGRSAGVIQLDLELVYGHCWGSGAIARGGEYRIDAAQISRRK